MTKRNIDLNDTYNILSDLKYHVAEVNKCLTALDALNICTKMTMNHIKEGGLMIDNVDLHKDLLKDG